MARSTKPSARAEKVSSSAPSLTLESGDVMRAMMEAAAAAKRNGGKDRDGENESDDGTDEEEGTEDDDEGSESCRSGESQSGGSASGDEDFERSTGSGGSDDTEGEEDNDRGEGSSTGSTRRSGGAASSTNHSRVPIAVPSRVKAATTSAAAPPTTATPSDPFGASVRPAEDTSFADLGLSQPLITSLKAIGIKKPTEIQAACVKAILAGRDCIGGAKTGSGKTMAFALPIVERIARDPFGVWAVILTPTRELAYQLTEQFIAVGRPLGLTTVTIVGGMDTLTQAKELEARPHIVVATPGRLCDLLRSDGMSVGKLSRVRTLVLDEADRLLTPTFAPDLAYLFSQVPPKRQTCLFTATVSEAIMDLAKKPPPAGKERPFVYRVQSDTLTVANLKQKYLFIPDQIRDTYLHYLLLHPPSEIGAALRSNPKPRKSASESRSNKGNSKKRRAPSPESEDDAPAIPSTIIFTQRCATAHILNLMLEELDIPSVPLHSHLTQPQRLLSLARFRAREVPILVTTDVGSRGLDIPEVAMVVNFDCPRRADDYVHRVGRTARAGRGGVAVTIVTERDVEHVKSIEAEINVELQELDMPEEQVLEDLNKVSVARRVATMAMHDSDFGERQATNKAKQIKRAKRDAARNDA